MLLVYFLMLNFDTIGFNITRIFSRMDITTFTQHNSLMEKYKNEHYYSISIS